MIFAKLTQQISVVIEDHRSLSRLHTTVYPDDRIVGWFTTGSIKESSVLLHEFYSKEMNGSPLLLVVDPELGLAKVLVYMIRHFPLILGN